MNYSSPSRLGDRSFPSRVSSSTHLDHWAFFPRPCTRIISINLQSNICEPLFISPYFFSPLPLMIWCLFTGLTPGSQVSPGPRCFAALCWRAGGCRTTGRPQPPHEEHSGKILGTLPKLWKSRTRNRRHIHKNENLYPESALAVIFFGNYFVQTIHLHIKSWSSYTWFVFLLSHFLFTGPNARIGLHVTVVCLWNQRRLMSFPLLNTLKAQWTKWPQPGNICLRKDGLHMHDQVTAHKEAQ